MTDNRDPRVSAGDAVGGVRGYDALDGAEQARVRAAWDERMGAVLAGLDLAEEFRQQGRSYVELDAAGVVVTRGPSFS